MTEAIKLAVCLPTRGGQLDAHHAGMWLNVGYTLADNREHFDLVYFGNIEAPHAYVARNIAVATSLAAGADFLLLVDADAYYCGQHDDALNDAAGVDILRMIRDAWKRGAAAVATPLGDPFLAVNLAWIREHDPEPPWFGGSTTSFAKEVIIDERILPRRSERP